jgi:glycine cleavage system H protein
MPDFLETTVDKFTFKVATDRFYNAEGVWAKDENGRVRIGLSDFVQQRSGDVAFAEIKPAGTVLAAGEEVAVIETIKVNITYTSPVKAIIVEVNPAMNDAPEAINQDPYGAARGWPAVHPSGWQVCLLPIGKARNHGDRETGWYPGRAGPVCSRGKNPHSSGLVRLPFLFCIICHSLSVKTDRNQRPFHN